MRGMRIYGEPGEPRAFKPSSIDVAMRRGYGGGDNPYEEGTEEHATFEKYAAVSREYEAAKAANGGRIPEGW